MVIYINNEFCLECRQNEAVVVSNQAIDKGRGYGWNELLYYCKCCHEEFKMESK